ncbi:hypothetical protein BCCH1_81580 (plasmid) [Burkholderia contaminans]|uniref:Uncharacterized protein n=1 Tax=Burkholderia contaminans TaxID=488447 RepID=A0A286T7Z8_9BURK|nr:hypothetical protein BCCH1_76190 [Burkholderia contaminans]BBA45647.1 hypothetical protein BCCH1_81580 [Burkholderia contaminans]
MLQPDVRPATKARHVRVDFLIGGHTFLRVEDPNLTISPLNVRKSPNLDGTPMRAPLFAP